MEEVWLMMNSTIELQGFLIRHRPKRKQIAVKELVAICPSCRTFETLVFHGDILMETRKFRQHDGGVYHDCGSHQRCQMFRSI